MEQKVIVVTGASSGMGKDFALHLLAKGHTVYGLARRVNHMQDIVRQSPERRSAVTGPARGAAPPGPTPRHAATVCK